jgi:hypothetical protein
MKIYIDREYGYMMDFVREIPQHEYQVQKVFRNNRNIVELTQCQDTPLVVKKFKRPTLANCVIYTFLRRTKPQRAFDNALMLRSMGIDTATPVAYIEQKRHGFFHTGWFIAKFLPYDTLDKVYDSLPDEASRKQLISAFLQFTVDMANKGIINKDYNSTNILTHKERDGQWHFALVDINRIRLGRPKLHDEAHALEQLGASPELLVKYLPQYAQSRKLDQDELFAILYVGKLWHKFTRAAKEKIKRMVGITPKK